MLRSSKKDERVLILCVLGGHQLEHLLKMKSCSVSISGTTEESALVKMHPELVSVTERSDAITA